MTFDKQFKSYDLDIHGVRLPQFDIEKRHKHQALVSEDCSNYDFLRQLCLNGFKDFSKDKIDMLEFKDLLYK